MSTRIREIIQKYFQNNQSKKIRRTFSSWVKDESNKEEKETAFVEIWDTLDIQADSSTEKSFNKLLSTIQATDIVVQKKHSPFIHKLLRIAAIIMLPILSVGITYYLMKDSAKIEHDVKLVECIVPNGEIRTIILPDSSIVKVNSGSILIYPQKFSNSRDIFLNGEAYFTVTKDKTKPFIVKTSELDVEVLGTIFNVSAYTDNDNSSTTLESGKVNVKFKNTDKEPVILHPDEQIVYNKNLKSVEKKNVKIENTIAWTEGNMIIQSMSINEVVKIIERKYAVTVYLNSNKYQHERITMKVTDGETVTEFMLILQYLVPQLKYKINDDKLYIY